MPQYIRYPSGGVSTVAEQGAPTTDANAWPVVGVGRSSVLNYRNDYSSVNVTTGTYVQVVASTSAAIRRLYVFDSSGSVIILATGAAASESPQIYITPGGTSYPYELAIPAGTRLAIKALDTSATSGQIVINALG
jgi:hypothetical protein